MSGFGAYLYSTKVNWLIQKKIEKKTSPQIAIKMPVWIPQPDDLVAFILYIYIICGCEHVKSHWKCLNYMGNTVHPFYLNLFNLFTCINFFRLAIPWKQTAALGKSSCADKIKRLSVWKVRTDRKLNKLEGTIKQAAIIVFPFHRRNSVLCTWFEAHTHINNHTSSINILDYYSVWEKFYWLLQFIEN